MKKLVFMLCLLSFLFALVSCDLIIQSGNDSSSSNTDLDEKNQNHESENKNEEKEDANEDAEDAADLLLKVEALNGAYEELKSTINEEYNQLESEYDEAIREVNTAISDYQYAKNVELSELERKIDLLEKQAKDAYAQASALTGGYGSSYANSIKSQYDSEISILKNQKSSVEKYYNEQISYGNQLLRGLTSEKAALREEKQEELNDLDEWYQFELEAIYSE